MSFVTSIGDDDEVWARIEPGESFSFGRTAELVDRVVSDNVYLSRLSGVIVGTHQTCWVQNWSTHTPFLLTDLGTTRSTIEVPAGTQRLNPFAEARLDIFATPGEQISIVVRCPLLAQLDTIDGRKSTDTRSEGLDARRVIRKKKPTSTSRRQWYACVALCEPLLRVPPGPRHASHQDIAIRLGPIIDVETGSPVEADYGKRPTADAVGKRLLNVRKLLGMVDFAPGQGAGMGDPEAPARLAEFLVRSQAVTANDVQTYLGAPRVPAPDVEEDE